MIAFFLPHTIVAATIAAYLAGRPWAFAIPAWTFLAGIVIDQLFSAPDREVLVPHGRQRSWNACLYAWAPLHVLAVICALHAVTNLPEDSQFWPQLLALAVSLSMVGGTLGGALAHEFMHVPRMFERVLGTALMSLITYGHFAIGHVAGHHRLVGTESDPATARRGESLYAFLGRAVIGGCALAWHAEARRLRRRHRPLWSIDNRILQVLAWQALLYTLIATLAGWRGVVLFALQSAMGASLLEVMNYIMHYALRRHRLSSGRLEAVRPHCSWNTRRFATTYLMCGIGLHSYHHCRPSKPFPTLRFPASAPELPGGLFAMYVLAWVPPLWRTVMDPLADLWMRPAVPVQSTAPDGAGE